MTSLYASRLSPPAQRSCGSPWPWSAPGWPQPGSPARRSRSRPSPGRAGRFSVGRRQRCEPPPCRSRRTPLSTSAPPRVHSLTLVPPSNALPVHSTRSAAPDASGRSHLLRRWIVTSSAVVSLSQRSSGMRSPATGSPASPLCRFWASILSPGSVSTLSSGPKRPVSSGG
jgi:hypothetical protein